MHVSSICEAAPQVPMSIDIALPQVPIPKEPVTARIQDQRAIAPAMREILPFAFVSKDQYTAYRKKLWQNDPICVYCHKRMAWNKSTLDHIQPKSKGGLDTPTNLVLACEGCNHTKDGRSLVEWTHDLIEACAVTCQTLVIEPMGVS